MDIGCVLANLLIIYTYVLLIRIVLSWVTMFRSPSPAFAPIIEVIYSVTEPVLGFARRYIPAVGGLDLSPILVFFLIRLAAGALC